MNNNYGVREKNLYQILEIDSNAQQETIKKAYKKLSLKYHPDKQINSPLSNEDKSNAFIKIREAYEVLSDPDKRKKYDREISINNLAKNDLESVIQEFQNMLSNKEYIIFMDILDNKIKQSLLNNIKIDNLLFQINQMNLIDILYTINNFKLLDIEIKMDFTIQELYNNTYKKIKYNRVTKQIFEEIIYPIDLTQIYESEGENITVNKLTYSGNFVVNVNIINTLYNGLSYQILGNDLYVSINKKLFYCDT
jgi:DnaJ-class molecular chaperone